MKEKRDFGQVINDFDGKPVQLGATKDTVLRAANRVIVTEAQRLEFAKALNEECSKPLTLCEATLQALRQGFDDERNLPEKERMDRFQLALRCNKLGMVKIDPTERDLIKKCIGKLFLDHLVVATCHLMLEGKEIAPAPEEPDVVEKE